MQNENFLRPKDAAKKAGVSISHLYRLVAEGKFPQPVRVSERISAFLASEIDAWIAERTNSARQQSEAS